MTPTTRIQVEAAKCFAADGVTPTYTAPGLPIMVSAVAFNELYSRITRPQEVADVGDEQADEIANECFRRLVTAGYNGGMGGQTWDRELVRTAIAASRAPEVVRAEPEKQSQDHLANAGNGGVQIRDLQDIFEKRFPKSAQFIRAGGGYIEKPLSAWNASDYNYKFTIWKAGFLDALAAQPKDPAPGPVAVGEDEGERALCSVCGCSRHVAAHRPLLSGPYAGQPLNHAFVAREAPNPANDIEVWPAEEFHEFMRKKAWGDVTDYPRGSDWHWILKPGIDTAIFLRELRDRVVVALDKAGRLKATPGGAGGDVGASYDWEAAAVKLCTDWDVDREIVESIFEELLPHWVRDPNQTHIWLSIDQLTRRDDYGVYGSDFYSCRLCDAESGAGVLNKGIPHESGCPLHDDNYGKLIATPAAEQMADWGLDISTGTPILVYKKCSVIESEQARYVLGLIAAEQGDAKGPDSFHSGSGDRDRVQGLGTTDAPEKEARQLFAPAMNIHGPRGRKVVYTGENGYPGEHVYAAKAGLIVGAEYVIERCDIHSSSTSVFLAGIKGGWNSVIFADVKDWYEYTAAILASKATAAGEGR